MGGRCSTSALTDEDVTKAWRTFASAELTELSDLFERYSEPGQRCGKPVLAFDTFCLLMKDVQSERLSASAIVRCARAGKEHSRAIFNAFDINNDDAVSEQEFMVGFCIYTNASAIESAKFLFHAMDKDNSGFVDKQELQAHMTRLVKMLRQIFPEVMKFQASHGNETTREALEVARELLVKKGEHWLMQKENCIAGDCVEIWKLLVHIQKAKANQKGLINAVGLDAWLEASRTEPRVFALMSLQEMMEQMRQVTIVRGSKMALPFHKFLKGACFLAEDSEQSEYGNFTEFKVAVDELSFDSEGSSNATLTTLVQKTFAIEGAAGMRNNHQPTKKPKVSCETLSGVWELDLDDPKLMTVEFDRRIVRSFMIDMEGKRLCLYKESGVELERGRVFHLQGTAEMGTDPVLPTLMDQWSNRKEGSNALPTAEIAIIKQNNREKLQAFMADCIE